MATAKAKQRRRAEQRPLDALQPGAHLTEHLRYTGRVRSRGDDRDEMAHGRVAERRAPLELLGKEPGDVVSLRELERHRIRLEGLHEHEPGRVAPAASGELGDELERSLLGSEVGNRETRVGVDDRGEIDTREVVSLRDHLRAHEHCSIGVPEALDRLAKRSRARSGVGIEPDPLELGHVPLELLLEPLRAGADVGELRRAAGGARRPAPVRDDRSDGSAGRRRRAA